VKANAKKVEFGDFQTPAILAREVCQCLLRLGVKPDYVIEPTCGVGVFLSEAQAALNAAKLVGYEVNSQYVIESKKVNLAHPSIEIVEADFFKMDWDEQIRRAQGSLLTIGNLPWVTNASLGAMDSVNIPHKENFHNRSGLDAMTGAANFDISEWMVLEILRWYKNRNGHIALLVKTAVARKILTHTMQQKTPIKQAFIAKIDAKKHFDVAVDACLLFVEIDANSKTVGHGYTIFDDLSLTHGQHVDYREGWLVSNADAFDLYKNCIGKQTSKWRSGIKHDAASVCELHEVDGKLKNGLDEQVDIEQQFLFPLLKGSDVANGARWRNRYLLVTQQAVGQRTDGIEHLAPKTWNYLRRNAEFFDRRGSSIYKNNPQFSIFGVGTYTFSPWKIAICALYKRLTFSIIAPIEGKPVVFDDTVYYLSYESEKQAQAALRELLSAPVQGILNAMIFWDDKRPIKTSILNRIHLASGQATSDTQAQTSLMFAEQSPELSMALSH
jgi:hypothetical protein